MKRLIWLPVAGFLLIAGATVAAAAPSLLSITPSTAASDTDAGDVSVAGLRVGGLLEEVLGDLVDQSVISQEQADAIVAALQEKADERVAEMEARRDQMRQNWELIRGFLEDGVITQDEINQLPEDSPLREVFNSIADEGQVTLDQLRELGPGVGRGFGPGFGHGRGHGAGGPGGPGSWLDLDSD